MVWLVCFLADNEGAAGSIIMQNNDAKNRQNEADTLEAAEAGKSPDQPADDPGMARVQSYLLYSLSLPERTLRSTTAVVGGALGGSMKLLVPQAFRSSHSYTIFVQQMLDFMVEDVGGVELPRDETETEDAEVEAFVARKTVGTFVEIAGWATLHFSPVTVLAIFSDLAYGSKTYLNELSEELKAKGVIDPETTIDQVSDLLDAVSKTSGMTAQAFDMPPISLEGLKKTVEQTRQAIAKTSPTQLIPQSEVKRLWNEMKETAEQQEVNLLSISSTMTLYALNKVGTMGKGTLSAVTVAGNMFDRHILDHYRSGLGEIRSRGVYTTLSENSQPYMVAAWNNFCTSKSTITEDLLSGALFARGWRAVRDWFRRRRKRKNKVPKQAQVSAGDENEPAET
ncbi:MAG: hypothetical protein VB877_16535 [Pirellulaceae bacterium]